LQRLLRREHLHFAMANREDRLEIVNVAENKI
jgi:hypothetical protein